MGCDDACRMGLKTRDLAYNFTLNTKNVMLVECL